MDIQDHGKIHLPGNGSHGVHVCRKCGWKFPNPHPSSKHRRAHKKVCGKIEGLKLIDSEDKSHLAVSDEDHKSPEGAKLEEMRNDEKSRSGIHREESNRSEDEVFTDANTEFADIGTNTAIEMLVVKEVRGTETCGERISVSDITRSVTATATSDIIQPSNDPIEDGQMQNPQSLNCIANQLGSSAQCQGKTSSSTISSVVDSQLDKGTNSSVVDLIDNGNDSPCFLSPMKDEAQVYASCGNTSTHPGENMVDCYKIFDGQNVDAKGDELNRDLEGNLIEMASSKRESEELELDSKSEVIDSSDCFLSPMKDEGPEYISCGNTSTHPGENVVECPTTYDGKNVDAKGNETSKDLEEKLTEMVPSKSESEEPELDSQSEVMESSACILSHVKDEAPVYASCGDMSTHPGEILAECPMISDGQNVDAKGKEKSKDLEGNLLEMAPNKAEGEEPEVEFNPQLRDSNAAAAEISFDVINSSTNIARDPIALENIVDSNREQINALEPLTSQNDTSKSCLHSTEIEANEHVGAIFVDTRVAADTAQERNIESPDNAVENCRLKGEKTGNDSTLSVPADISVEDHSEMAAEDCKIRRPMESKLSETPECSKAVEDSKDCSVNLVYQETQLGEISSKSGDIAEVSLSAVQVPEDKFQQESSKVEDIFVDCKADIFTYNAIQSQGFSSARSEALPDSTFTDVTFSHTENGQTDSPLEELESHNSEHDQICKTVPEKPAEVLAVKEAMVSPIDAEVHETTIVSSNGNNGVYDESMARTLISGGATEENSMVAANSFPETKPLLHSDNGINQSEKDLQEVEPKLLETIVDTSGIGNDRSHLKNETEVHSNLHNCQDEDVQEASKEIDDVNSSAYPSPVGNKEIQGGAENLVLKEPTPSVFKVEFCDPSSVKDEDSSTEDFGRGASDIHSESLLEEVDIGNKHVGASAAVPADISVGSSSQNDSSVEGYWGSVSDGTVPSTRYASDAPPILDTETLPLTITQAPSKETEEANSNKARGALEEQNADILEPPSFMTLVEPGKARDQKAASSEIQAARNPQQLNSSSIPAGWFPSVTHVVKESQGRKKNKEVIAKVVNWSPGKLHAPLKSLLIEANLESKQKALNTPGNQTTSINKDEAAAQDNGLLAEPLPSMPASVATTPHEWNSPARLPNDKRGKRKAKGKLYWVPFVCCSSVNKDP